MNKYISIVIASLLISSCANTGVVKLEKDTYMVSEKNAKIGFVSASEEKAAVYKQANEFCAKQAKEVETVNLEMRDSGAFKQASATLEFKCK